MKQGEGTGLAIFSLILVILIDALGWGIVYPSLEPILLHNVTNVFSASTSVDLRNFWYESMVGLYMLCMFIMSPLLGSLSDRYGRRIILAASMFGNALGFFIAGIGVSLSSLTLLVIGRLISGATAGSLPIAQAAMMDISTSEEKPRRLSLVALANVTGFALGPVIGAFCLNPFILGKSLPYALPFWLVVGVALLGMFLVLYLFKETFVGVQTVKISIFTGFLNLYEAIKLKNSRWLCLAFSFFMLSWAMFFSLIPLLLADRFKWRASTIGYFISFTAVFLGLGVVFIMPRLVKWFRLESIVYFSFTALIFCMVLFPLIHREIFLWIVIVLTIAVPLAYVALASLLSEVVGVDEQGKMMGVLGSLIALSWGLGPILSGYVVDFSFSLAYLFVVISICLALLIFIKNFKKQLKLFVNRSGY